MGYSEQSCSTIESQLAILMDCYSFTHSETGNVFMAGDNTYRLSADYSTGAAGVLSVLQSYKSLSDEWVPFSKSLSSAKTDLKGGE